METFINENMIYFHTYMEGRIWVTDIYDEHTSFRFNNDYRYFPNYEKMTADDLYKLTGFKADLSDPKSPDSKDIKEDKKVSVTLKEQPKKGGRKTKK